MLSLGNWKILLHYIKHDEVGFWLRNSKTWISETRRKNVFYTIKITCNNFLDKCVVSRNINLQFVFSLKHNNNVPLKKGRGSLTINFSYANFEVLFYKKFQNITMVTQYNFFTVKKWFITIECVLHEKLDVYLCTYVKKDLLCYLTTFLLKIKYEEPKERQSDFQGILYRQNDNNTIWRVSIGSS